ATRGPPGGCDSVRAHCSCIVLQGVGLASAPAAMRDQAGGEASDGTPPEPKQPPPTHIPGIHTFSCHMAYSACQMAGGAMSGSMEKVLEYLGERDARPVAPGK